MTVLVAQIIPMDPDNCAECGQRVATFNNAIPGWTAAISTPQSPAIVVDHSSGFDTASGTYDGVHSQRRGGPEDGRSLVHRVDRRARRDAAPDPPAPPTSEPPAPAPSEDPTTPGSGCSAEYVIANQWRGGFQGQ